MKENNIKNDYYKAYELRYKQTHNKGYLWEYSKYSPVAEKFLNDNNVTVNNTILDLGCGEGRDAIYLLNKGYNVTAIDYSQTAINKCNELTNNKFKTNFKQLDIFDNSFSNKYDYIYSISVLHMFLLDEHRDKYFEFIFDHLNKNGKALITILGNGTKETTSDIRESFDLSERIIQSIDIKIEVPNTSCRIVNWSTLEKEIKKSRFKIEKKWIENEIPGFQESMCVIVYK